MSIGASGRDESNAAAAPQRVRGSGRLLGRLVLPFEALTAVAEALVSRRGLATIFLAVAGWLVLLGWVRPPLSRDISSLHLSLGLWPGENASPVGILHGPRQVPPDSVGVLFLVLLAFGLVVVWRRPQRLALVAGILFAFSLCANAAVAFNHPALIELLDREYEQRRQVGNLLMVEFNDPSVANDPRGRISSMIGDPGADAQCADLYQGCTHLLYGRWLIVWLLGGFLLASRGALVRRLAAASAFAVVGTALACAVCLPRLVAEFRWAEAKRLEAQGDQQAARQALARAVDWCPEFKRLERTWLLTGKLDHLAGQHTPQQRFFEAFQLARDQNRARNEANLQDLPWVMAEYRPSPERRRAAFLMEELRAADGGKLPPVQRQTARLWKEIGLAFYRTPPVLTESGREYPVQDRQLGAAEQAWRRALAVSPRERDTALFLGMARARADRDHPGYAEAEAAPMLDGLDDALLRADVLFILGDAYFEAGLMNEARTRYADSCTSFTLPKVINYRGLKGVGGL